MPSTSSSVNPRPHSSVGESDDDDYDEPFSTKDSNSASNSLDRRVLSADDFRGGAKSKPPATRVLSFQTDLTEAEQSLASAGNVPAQKKIVVKANPRVRVVAAPRAHARKDPSGASAAAATAGPTAGGCGKKAIIPPKNKAPHRNPSTATTCTDIGSSTVEEYQCLDSSSVEQSVYTSRTSSGGSGSDKAIRQVNGKPRSTSQERYIASFEPCGQEASNQPSRTPTTPTTPKGQLKAALSLPPEYCQAMAPNPNFNKPRTMSTPAGSLTPSFVAESRARGMSYSHECEQAFSKRTILLVFGVSLLVSMVSLFLTILIITEAIAVGKCNATCGSTVDGPILESRMLAETTVPPQMVSKANSDWKETSSRSGIKGRR